MRPNAAQAGPRETAVALLDAVYDAPSAKRLSRILEAIDADPSLTEAYIAAAAAMAQDAPEAEFAWRAALELARRDAGERLQSEAGHLWDDYYGRPYMEAAMGYAECCLSRGKYNPAIVQLRRLLFLDDRDRPGARYLMGPALVLASRAEEFEGFRAVHGDETFTAWLYVDAFAAIAFKASAQVRNARISRALEANPFVPLVLLDAIAAIDGDIAYFERGGLEEAIHFAESPAGRMWRADHRALATLARAAGGRPEA